MSEEIGNTYLGWGVHQMNDAPVFMMQLENDPNMYAHEFYIDIDHGKKKLHHRMIDGETGKPAFAEPFDMDTTGNSDALGPKDIVKALITKQEYWLGIVNVENDMIDEIRIPDVVSTETVDFEDSMFMEQEVRPEALKELVRIANRLYVDE